MEVDLEGLLASLRSREYYSLPLEVRPRRRGTDLVALAEAVNTALGAAAVLAEARVPNDPTTSTSADVALKSVVIEVNDGLMSEAEVTTWLTDFATALQGQQVRVVAASLDKRIPNGTLDAWLKEPLFAPAAFLHFTAREHKAPNGRLLRYRDPETIDAIADYLAGWVRLPSGVTTVSRGLTEFVCPPNQVAEQLRDVHDPQMSVTAFTLHPRRFNAARFGFKAMATMSYFDETIETLVALDRLLDALRAIGHLLEYAYVRMDRPVMPNEYVGEHNLRRAPTVAEKLFTDRYNNADEFAIGPCVAQVLNPRHLAKGPALGNFACEELDNGRLLAVARDPAPWIGAPNPPTGLLERFAADFGPITLTQADYERERASDRERWNSDPP